MINSPVINKDLLYSTRNSAQGYVAAWMGGEFGGEWAHIYVWLVLLRSVWNSHNFVNWLSVQFSRSVVSDSLPPHGLQHSRPPCPSPTPGSYSNSCPSSRWCHPTISSSVVPFSSCLQSPIQNKKFKKKWWWGGEWSNSETYWVSVIKSPVLGVGWFLSLYWFLEDFSYSLFSVAPGSLRWLTSLRCFLIYKMLFRGIV